MRVAVTGKPGVGKTTLCLKVYEALKGRVSISGFVTREVRERGKRVGFMLQNLETGEEEWLAKIGEGVVRVGKYSVNVAGFENFLRSLKTDAELIIIDEVGPMELKSGFFVRFIEALMEKPKLLFTIHLRSKHSLVERIRREFEVYHIDELNRNRVAEEIVRLFEG